MNTNTRKSFCPTQETSNPSRIVFRLSTASSIQDYSQRKEAFEKVLPEIINTLCNSFEIKDVPGSHTWIKEVIEYNVTGGKLLRGLATVMAYELFERPENITEESLRLSRVMGWCVEMGYGVVLDDIMDKSVTRRGVPCWYTLPGVGLRAVNDAGLLYACTTLMISSCFGHMPQYRAITDLLSDTFLFTSFGQKLDFAMSRPKSKDYSAFTMHTYDTIAKYKTSYYTYNLPIGLGIILANRHDAETMKRAKDICLKIGGLFQMQDDFIDLFKPESVSGKLGTDAQEGKCTWLAAAALRRCSDAQRRVFAACYGSTAPAHVDRIRRLYEQLQLPEVYREEERTRREEVLKLAEEFGDRRVAELFLKLVDRIAERVK